MYIAQTQCNKEYYYFLEKTEADNPCEFWNAYRPFMHSWKSKQANDILLKE